MFTISIEMAGRGFWLLFEHGAPNRRREEIEPAGKSTALVPIDRRGAVELQVIDEKPGEIVERFFLKVVRPRLNGRVPSMAVWTAYQVWCEQRGYSAGLSHVWLAGALAEGSRRAALSGTLMLNSPRATSA